MKSMRQQTRRTVQSLTREDRQVGTGILFNLIKAGEIIAPWWSRERDRQLRDFTVQSDHFQGAEWMISAKLANVPFRIEPRNRSIKRHQKLANQYQVICQNMLQFGKGWGEFWSRFYSDLWSTDNGAFAEVIGGGRPGGPLKGPAIGLAHLDSLQCSRTSNPEWPVIYQDFDGKRYKFHHTRIIFASQQPSASGLMNSVGHCWLSRAINNVQQLVDQDVYFQEALGSRPLRQMLIGRGIATNQVVDAIKMAEEGMDNQGLSRYAKTAFLGSRNNTNIGIDSVPFTFLPDGYDKQQQTSIAMFVIALAGGFPPRWIWPATAAGATKADAMFQHISGSGGGAQWHLNMMRDLLSYSNVTGDVPGMLPPKFIPKELKLTFDFQDDEQDRQQAEIQDKRANTRKTDIEDGVVTIRVAREQALADGDLTPAQFAQMELEDGRLPDGDDVLTLFDSTDELTIEMLDLGVDEPLAIDLNDAIDMMIAIESAALAAQTRMVQARSTAEKEKARQAIEALGKLKSIYEEIVGKEIEEEIAAEQATGEFVLPETTPETPGEGESAEATEEKARTIRAKIHQRKQENFNHSVDFIVSEILTLNPAESECKQLIDGYLYELEHNTKAFKFGARMGERIRGGLFRGRGGKFASEADIGAIKSEILGRLIARLRAARTGTGKGGKGKKPKKAGGGGGGKKKPSAEELARKKAEADKKARAETFASIKDVDAAEMESLADFISGGELTPEQAQSLAQQGFVKFDSSGQPITTGAGRSVISAATKGDKQRTVEAISKAREQVAKTQARADKKRERATQARERAADLQERAESANEDAAELDDDADELLAEAKAEPDEKKAKRLQDRAEKLQERAEKKRAQAADLQERAAEQDERAATLDIEASEIDASIGGGDSLLPVADKPPTDAAPEQPTASETPQKPPTEQKPTRPTAADVPQETAPAREPTQEDLDTLTRLADNLNSGSVAELRQLIDAGLIDLGNIPGQVAPRLTTAGKAALNRTKATTEPPHGYFDLFKGVLANMVFTVKPDGIKQLVDNELLEIDAVGEPKLTSVARAIIIKTKVNKKSLEGFVLNIHAAIRGLWAGNLDQFDFVESMISAIERGFNQAWTEGALECGIGPDERTPEESEALRNLINNQFVYLPGFAADIEASNRASGGKLGPLYSRGDGWINQYNSVRGQAKLMACGNQKLKWNIDPTKDNCPSCLKLKDKVKRASYWAEQGVRTQNFPNDKLECTGLKCGCSQDPTNEPLSKGPLPSLP